MPKKQLHPTVGYKTWVDTTNNPLPPDATSGEAKEVKAKKQIKNKQIRNAGKHKKVPYLDIPIHVRTQLSKDNPTWNTENVERVYNKALLRTKQQLENKNE